MKNTMPTKAVGCLVVLMFITSTLLVSVVEDRNYFEDLFKGDVCPPKEPSPPSIPPKPKGRSSGKSKPSKGGCVK